MFGDSYSSARCNDGGSGRDVERRDCSTTRSARVDESVGVIRLEMDHRIAQCADNSGDVEKILEQMFGEIVTGKGGSAKDLADKYQAQLKAL